MGDFGNRAAGIDHTMRSLDLVLAGVLAAADTVFDAGLGAVAGFEKRDLPVGVSVTGNG
ncbi:MULTISPECIES: hypothetical protein [unclassified Amycolatopsis]|uniref:hypothetical protein n=1 Tax=unclassified Amycolatopsis TaxID=2618356 RepID=UPI0013150F28